MIHKMTLAVALVGAMAIGGAGLLSAQGDEVRMGMMSMMASCPMLDAVTEGPAAVLQHRDTLQLTPDQGTRLDSLRDDVAKARRAGIDRMREIHGEITSEASGDSFDEVATRNALNRMSDLHADMAMAVLRARHQARHVLTLEQREIFAGLRSGRMGMASMWGMGGMMEMMKNCPRVRHQMSAGSNDRGPSGHSMEGSR